MQPENLDDILIDTNRHKIIQCESIICSKKKNRRKKFRSKIPIRIINNETCEQSLTNIETGEHMEQEVFIIEAPEQFRENFETFAFNEPKKLEELTVDTKEKSLLLHQINNYVNKNEKKPTEEFCENEMVNESTFSLTENLNCFRELPFYKNEVPGTISTTITTEIKSIENEEKSESDDEIVSCLRKFFDYNNEYDKSTLHDSHEYSDEKSMGKLVDIDIDAKDNDDVDVSVQIDNETKHASSYQFSVELLDFIQPNQELVDNGYKQTLNEVNNNLENNEIILISSDNDQLQTFEQELQTDSLQIDKKQEQNCVPICQKCSNPIFYDESYKEMIAKMGQDINIAKTSLKPSLKKSNKNRDLIDSSNNPNQKKKKNHHVVFNESKNEFFEADYIILIREECDYPEDDDYDFDYDDDEEDDNNNDTNDCECTCDRNLSDKLNRLRQQQNIQLKCCNEPNCCYCYDYDDDTDKSGIYCEKTATNDCDEIVTLSPPDGYKDMDLGEKQLMALKKILNKKKHQQFQYQSGGLCKDCIEQQETDLMISSNFDDTNNLKVTKIDQYPHDLEKTANQIVMETVTTTTVTERRIIRKEQSFYPIDSHKNINNINQSPVNGILKGGKLWKQSSLEFPTANKNQQLNIIENVKDDDNSKRTVRFSSEATSRQDKRDFQQQQQQQTSKPEELESQFIDNSNYVITANGENKSLQLSAENSESIMPFKIGNQLLLSNNSLRPNSAVRQLFPDSKTILANGDSDLNYVNYQKSQFSDESVRRVIERNTLRRSLIKYEPKTKKTFQVDNSLVEKIKQLTCDIENQDHVSEFDKRYSPAGEETCEKIIDETILNKSQNLSSNSLPIATTTSTYKKITDLFSKKDKNQSSHLNNSIEMVPSQNAISRINAVSEARKQLLTSLVPFTTCVTAQTSIESNDVYEVTNNSNMNDERFSNSSVGTDYSLQDIDEVLKTHIEDKNQLQNHSRPPDVLHGTTETSDELAIFVQQDASRIERLKKKYQSESNQSNTNNNNEEDDEDDEHNDYGFNKRPNVRGIIKMNDENTNAKKISDSETMPMKKCQLNCCNNRNNNNNNILQQYTTTTQMPMIYPYELNQMQKVTNNRLQNRPQSPPPLEVARNYQQTMIFIPYNNLIMNENNIVVPQHISVPNFYHHQYMGGQMISSTTQTSYMTRQHKNSYSYSSSSSSNDSYRTSKDLYEHSPTQFSNYLQRSPSKSKFTIDRGVPEGASQDLIIQTQSTMTSPSMNNYYHNSKPVFHAMNV